MKFASMPREGGGRIHKLANSVSLIAIYNHDSITGVGVQLEL